MLQICNILGRTISFTLKYIEIRKHFLKYHSPHVPAKAFACICVTIFYTLYEVACWHKGGGDVQQPKNPGPKPIKCLKISLLFNDKFFCKCPVLIYLHAMELFMVLFSSADFLQN